MKKKTVAELDKDSISLMEFFTKQNPGAELSYLAIENGSGVKMNVRGKGLMRRALHRMRLEYSCARGYGIVLADTDMVMPILSTKITRIDRAVKRGDRSQKNLQEQFFNSLGPDQQRQILFAGAVFGAIRVAAEQGRMLYSKNRDGSSSLGPVTIDLPKFG